MGELSIHVLQPAEFDQVWPIFRAVVADGDTYTYAPDTDRETARTLWTTPPARTYVAERDGVPLGCYLLKPNQPGLGDHVANAGYMVAPEARGQGIASAMCAHSLDEARRRGFRAMQYNFVVSTNEGAIRLWQRHGFQIVGRVPAAFRHATRGLTDILVMHRQL